MFSWPFLLAGLVLISIRFAIRNTGLVEHYYSRGIYPFIAFLFSSLSKIFPFSLWDIFWLLIIIFVFIGLVLVVFRKVEAGWYLVRTLQLIAVLYAFFYFVWGYNYFRPKVDKRLGWKITENNESNFRSILDSIIKQTNYNYISVSSTDFSVIDSLIEASYSTNSTILGIDYPNGTRRPKKMLLSSLFSKLGVSGYFGPFFNEIHLNSNLLPMDYPYVLGHEKAHQFGITSEAEANLFAYIVCVSNNDKRLKYSGYQSLLLYFLRDAALLKDYRDYLNKIDKRVLEDLRYRQNYYEKLQNKNLSEMQSAVNDSYLKANNIERGIKNYNEVVSLVLNWYYNSNNY
jgi:hypothetical protein